MSPSDLINSTVDVSSAIGDGFGALVMSGVETNYIVRRRDHFRAILGSAIPPRRSPVWTCQCATALDGSIACRTPTRSSLVAKYVLYLRVQDPARHAIGRSVLRKAPCAAFRLLMFLVCSCLWSLVSSPALARNQSNTVCPLRLGRCFRACLFCAWLFHCCYRCLTCKKSEPAKSFIDSELVARWLPSVITRYCRTSRSATMRLSVPSSM